VIMLAPHSKHMLWTATEPPREGSTGCRGRAAPDKYRPGRGGVRHGAHICVGPTFGAPIRSLKILEIPPLQKSSGKNPARWRRRRTGRCQNGKSTPGAIRRRLLLHVGFLMNNVSRTSSFTNNKRFGRVIRGILVLEEFEEFLFLF
jgi:hypothetical protein